MKVLVISAAFPPMRAGEADHAFHLCRNLADHGLDVHVLTTKTNQKMEGLPFQIYPLIRNWSWLDLFTMMRFLRFCSPDAVILLYSGWIYNAHPMITFVPTISKFLLPRTPFVTQFEIVEPSIHWGSILRRAILKMVKQWAGPKGTDVYFGTLFRDSDHIIGLSEHHLARFSERFPFVKEKSDVIPPPPLLYICPERNGASRRQGRASLGVSNDEFLFAYFGFVDERKGIETLLEAFQIVSHTRENVRLIFIGGGKGTLTDPSDQLSARKRDYEQQMDELSKQLGIADKIIWTKGYTFESEQPSIYLRAADACTLPYDEGIRMNRSSFAAAAAHGLPIITTRGDILESPFVDQRNILLCEPRNRETLAAAMERLISNPELQARLKKGALELAHERFSWDRAVERTVNALSNQKKA